MTTKNAKAATADNEVAAMFALGGKTKAAGKEKAAAKPAEKAAAKPAAEKAAAPKASSKAKKEFHIYHDGVVLETTTAANLAAAQKKANSEWEEKVLAVPADADAAAVKEAKRESKKLAKEDAADEPKKPRGRAKIERSEEELEERHAAHLIRKGARRKCRSWMRANDVQALDKIVVQPLDDSFVFAVETEKKTIYLGLDADGEIEVIKAAVFKEAQAAAE